MTDNHWKRLGELLIERRVELGFPNRTKFAKDKGFPNTRVLSAIENAERQNFDPTTLTQVEIAYGWRLGSIKVVLQGGDPVATDADPGVQRMRADVMNLGDQAYQEAEAAQIEYERLIGELVAAEARLDAANRRVFAHLETEDLAFDGKRTWGEVLEMFANAETLVPQSRIAVQMAYYGTHTVHEWTRYEAALIERVFPGMYPAGSTSQYMPHLDMTRARAQASRISIPEAEMDRVPGVRLEIQPGTTGSDGKGGGSEDGEPSAQKSQFGLAAKPGQKEPDDEPQ